MFFRRLYRQFRMRLRFENESESKVKTTSELLCLIMKWLGSLQQWQPQQKFQIFQNGPSWLEGVSQDLKEERGERERYQMRYGKKSSDNCNTLHHTATRYNTLQHTATHYNTLPHTATHCNTL